MMNKKRLIDANALQLEPDPFGGMNGVLCLGRSGGKTMATVQAMLKRMIDNAPTVDAVEVVHGRWEKHWCDNSMIGHEFEECTECGCSMLDTNQFWDSNYCPNCGAMMDGGEDE